MGDRTLIHICITCRRADEPLEPRDERSGARLHRAVEALAAERGAPVDIVAVECLSVCKRPCTVGFAAPGKWTYVYGDLPAETGAETVLDGARLYAATADGLIPWRERPEALKRGVVARMPPIAPPAPAPFKEAAE